MPDYYRYEKTAQGAVEATNEVRLTPLCSRVHSLPPAPAASLIWQEGTYHRLLTYGPHPPSLPSGLPRPPFLSHLLPPTHPAPAASPRPPTPHAPSPHPPSPHPPSSYPSSPHSPCPRSPRSPLGCARNKVLLRARWACVPAPFVRTLLGCQI